MPDNPIIPPLLAHQGVMPQDPLARKTIEFMGGKFYKGIKIPLLGPFFFTWFAPKPFGITPPRYFGLPENYLLGYTSKEFFDLLLGEDAARGTRDRAARIAAAEQSKTRPELLLNLKSFSIGELETFATNTRDPRHTYSFPRDVIIEAVLLTYAIRTGLQPYGDTYAPPRLRPDIERRVEAFLAPLPIIPPPSAAGAPIDSPPASMAQAAAAAIAKEPVKFLVTERTDP